MLRTSSPWGTAMGVTNPGHVMPEKYTCGRPAKPGRAERHQIWYTS